MRFGVGFTAGLKRSRGPARGRLSARPVLECLEARELPSTSPMPAAVSIPTEVSQLARQLQADGTIPKPSGPTYLYLNFDGWTNCPYAGNGGNIGAFTGTATDEDNILYRTAEEFAPFNVIVEPMYGNGAYVSTGGATTVFVGSTGGGDFTPADFLDYPHSGDSHDGHGFNTDPYDLAFVDQNFQGLSTSPVRDASIANDVAHEAGHTFGLAHVRTDGMTDFPANPANVGTYVASTAAVKPDVMSYISNNDYFSNTAYNLTDANGGGFDTSQFPEYKGTDLVTQNSFAYLQAVLGPRPVGTLVGVADENVTVINAGLQNLNFVDPGFYASSPGTRPVSVATTSAVGGSIQRAGDYAAYRLDLAGSNWPAGQTLAITPTSGSPLTLLVYDETTQDTSAGTLVAASENSRPVTFVPEAKHTYVLVVGGTYGLAAGAYDFTAGPVQTNLAGLSFTLSHRGQTAGTLVVNSQSGSTVAGTFTPNDAAKKPLQVTGTVAALINGASSFTFAGSTTVVKTVGPEEYQLTTTQTITKVTFTGSVTPTATGYSLAGAGDYSVTVTTTVSDVRTHLGRRTTTVPEHLTFESGLAYSVARIPRQLVTAGSVVQASGSVPNQSVGGTTPAGGGTAAAAAGPARADVSALDALLAAGGFSDPRKDAADVWLSGPVRADLAGALVE